ATPGTGDETVVVNSFNNTGEFYVRVAGHAGAFDTGAQFTVEIAKGATDCAAVSDTTLTPRSDAAATGLTTVILTDSSRLDLGDTSPGTAAGKLAAFAARPEVDGVIVDVASDARVSQLKAQADANRACPFATNLLAEEIKSIVDSYRANNPGLRYVVVVGGDTVIPFFRYPDQSLLGQESGYVPPVRSDSISEAALRNDFVLSQDAYGSGVSVSLRTSDFPVPGLAVGRLVETPAEIAGMLDAYTSAGGVVAPGSSLVTGYDFLEDAANAVRAELQSGTGTASDTLITPNGVSPQDPASWTASQLRAKLFGSRHDVMFLAGHFSANSALAADFQTSVLTTELAASTVDLTNAIVFSAGCHSGYNIVDGEALPGVAEPLDWTQAFAQKRATLIAGTGYQYGDTDFLEYSERLYRDFARELRAGTGVVSIGEALARAKVTYLGTTPDIRGIHEKAILEATLFGLPMLGVNMPAGRGGVPGTGPTINPTEIDPVNGTDLELATHDLTVAPGLTPHTLNLKNPPYDAIPGTFTTASWLSGPNGVVTNPAEPALPLAAVNATSNDGTQVLRGVGFRGGTYTDTSPIVPLTGAPTTELRGVHAPFTSPVFYPMRMWNPNYYGELGGSGGTNLLVTPVQHRADPANPGSSVRRTFSNLNLRLFYSSNLTTAALSDAPSIVGVSAQPNGTAVDFAIQVVGDPKALVREVWITHTNGTGTWQALDLAQDPADSSRWLGSLPSAGPNLQFVVQAANGLGLVAFDDNRGSYYAASAGEPAATQLTLISPPSGGTFGESPVITAELSSGGSPVAGKAVIVSIGGSGVLATTGSNGRVAAAVPLNSLPGETQITASFAGDAAFGPSSDSHAPFTIGKATSSLSAFTTQASVVVAGGNSGVTTMLTAAVGSGAQPLAFETVTFTLAGPSPKTYSTITDFTGKATLPTSGLGGGTYDVTASFAGNATYTSATRTGAITVSTFTGFFAPVNNLPMVNSAKAGSTIPVKFSLGGDRGLAIFATGYPKATKIPCVTGEPVDAVEEVVTSASGLIYDPLTDRYVYNWKTLKSYAGSCYRLDVRFTDGSTFTASFVFNK
ncbi:MAG TPA: PxKF domain-containing protein, partial [Candidatus Limnocylindrales bacterium]|nr:PxKF domain-containing protein [Candidatus Limnocylindrales bacterium]